MPKVSITDKTVGIRLLCLWCGAGLVAGLKPKRFVFPIPSLCTWWVRWSVGIAEFSSPRWGSGVWLAGENGAKVEPLNGLISFDSHLHWIIIFFANFVDGSPLALSTSKPFWPQSSWAFSKQSKEKSNTARHSML